MRPTAFTLIELLVVISIIGLLSSIVLASMGVTRSKANDAKVYSTFHQIQNQWSLDQDSFLTPCSDTNTDMANLTTSISSQCSVSGAVWAIYTPLKNPQSGMAGLCWDSTGLYQQQALAPHTCHPTNCSASMAGCQPN